MKYLWTLILFTLMSVNAMAMGGKRIPGGEEARNWVHMPKDDIFSIPVKSVRMKGYDGKEMIIRANRKVSIEYPIDIIALTKVPEITILWRQSRLADPSIAWTTSIENGNRYVIHPNSGEKVLHNKFGPAKGEKGFYILGEKVLTEKRWLELRGKEGIFNPAEITFKRLGRDILEHVSHFGETNGWRVAHHPNLEVQKIEQLQNGGFKVIYYDEMFDNFPVAPAKFTIAVLHFNSAKKLHRDGELPEVEIRTIYTRNPEELDIVNADAMKDITHPVWTNARHTTQEFVNGVIQSSLFKSYDSRGQLTNHNSYQYRNGVIHTGTEIGGYAAHRHWGHPLSIYTYEHENGYYSVVYHNGVLL